MENIVSLQACTGTVSGSMQYGEVRKVTTMVRYEIYVHHILIIVVDVGVTPFGQIITSKALILHKISAQMVAVVKQQITTIE